MKKSSRDFSALPVLRSLSLIPQHLQRFLNWPMKFLVACQYSMAVATKKGCGMHFVLQSPSTASITNLYLRGAGSSYLGGTSTGLNTVL